MHYNPIVVLQRNRLNRRDNVLNKLTDQKRLMMQSHLS